MKNKRKMLGLASLIQLSQLPLKTGISAIILVTAINSGFTSTADDISSESTPLFNRLNKLEKQGKSNFQSTYLAPLSKDIEYRSHKFEAALVKGALVEDHNGNTFRIKKQIYIMALVSEEDPYTTYIINKKGIAQYFTHTRNVISIRRDVAIGTLPKKYKTYQDAKYIEVKDKSLILDSMVSGGVSSMSIPFATSVAPELGSQAMGFSGEARTYFKWQYPLSFGFTLGHRQVKEQGFGGYIIGETYAGPSLKYSFNPIGDHTFAAALSAGRSLQYTALIADDKYKLSSKFYQLNLEDSYKTRFGTIVIGGSYNYGILNAGKLPTNSNHESDRVVQTISLYIGKDFDIAL